MSDDEDDLLEGLEPESSSPSVDASELNAIAADDVGTAMRHLRLK